MLLLVLLQRRYGGRRQRVTDKVRQCSVLVMCKCTRSAVNTSLDASSRVWNVVSGEKSPKSEGIPEPIYTSTVRSKKTETVKAGCR